MNNASTADGRGQDGPNDAEQFFPSEGTFNSVVPLSEVGRAPVLPAPLPPVDAADAGQPAEAAWARESHRAGLKDEEETTLVPVRAGVARGTTAPGARRPWVFPAAVVALSVMAGLAAGLYLVWSAQRASEAQRSAQVEAEAPSPPPAPVVEEVEAEAKAEPRDEAAKAEKSGEVVKVEKSPEPARAAPTPRAARPARADDEVREVTPAPKPARSQSAPTPRSRVTTAARRQPAPAPTERTLPVSSPPPSAKSKKVIQWP